jgi:hypothetical protein
MPNDCWDYHPTQRFGDVRLLPSVRESAFRHTLPVDYFAVIFM